MNPLIPLYVTVSQFFQDRAERLRKHDDRGMEMVQTAALIVLTLAILTFLMGTIRIHEDIGNGVSEKVQKIFDSQK